MRAPGGGLSSTGERRLGALDPEVVGAPHGEGALAIVLRLYLGRARCFGDRDVSGQVVSECECA